MPRHDRPPVPAWAKPWIDGFRLSLEADRKSHHTVYRYCDAAGWLAGWLAEHAPDVDDLADVTKDHYRLFFRTLHDLGYSQKYVHNIGASIAMFVGWFCIEEGVPNPFAGGALKVPPAPKLGAEPPPVIAVEQLRALIGDAERGRDFESRRDAALLRVFAATGGRLTELTNLNVDDVDQGSREIKVAGKAGKVRTIRYDAKAALAINRYLRIRGKHRAAALPALWLGIRRSGPMTPSGVRQAIQRRAKRLDMKVWPHLFRHTFAHNWLAAGGAEGDLVELAGWESTQMLAVYGRSARSARARRAYDRVDVMGGV